MSAYTIFLPADIVKSSYTATVDLKVQAPSTSNVYLQVIAPSQFPVPLLSCDWQTTAPAFDTVNLFVFTSILFKVALPDVVTVVSDRLGLTFS